jgi:hypothetical protein
MRFIIIVLFLSTLPARAQTIYLNYSQWEQMPPSLREMYVTGAFDALSTITVPERAPIARYYNECVAKAGLTTGKLAENMKQYAETQPDLQKKPVPFALMRYLVMLCGTPTGQSPWQSW